MSAIVLIYGAGALVTREALEAEGLSSSAAWIGAASLGTAALVPFAVIVRWAWTDEYRSARPPRPGLLAAALILPVSVCLFFFLRLMFDLSAGLALVICAAYTAHASSVVRRQVVRFQHARVQRPIRVDDADDAAELVAECRAQLGDPAVSADARIAAEANLVAGLTALSMLADRHDGLPEAQAILERALNEASPAWVIPQAMLLIDAMMVKAERRADFDGLREALDLLAAAIDQAPEKLAYAVGVALNSRARGLLLLSNRANALGNPAAAERIYREAVRDVERAVSLAGRWTAERALWEIELAWIGVADPDHDDLDLSIARCRRALRRLRARGRRQRERGYLALADLLCLRAAEQPERFVADLSEALTLCRAVAARGSAAHHALARIPELLSALGAEPAQIALEYRGAFEQLSQFALGDASQLAAEWSRWAAEHDLAAEAAEAHWCQIRASVDDSRRRPLRAEQDRGLAQIQGLAADAGLWLLAAGRARDAAVALDIGRAVGLTERMHRERDGLAERLELAERHTLAVRWRDVCARIASADRAGFDPAATPSPPGTIALAGRRFQARFSSDEHVALAEHEQLLREIAEVPGLEDVDASPSYDDIQRAAAEGPIVYLAACAQEGYAIVVDRAWREPAVVRLANLVADDVARRADVLLRVHDEHELAEEMAALLGWLRARVMAPLVASLPARAVVTLVPTGRLSLLPIHAAVMHCAEDGSWRNTNVGLVFRYAPNARVLLRAQATARSLGQRDLPILTVDVADAAGHADLKYAALESQTVAAQFGAALARRPASDRVDDVLAALGESAIWHFACHGEHRAADPLRSCLRLRDGPLTLQAIFARPAGRARLAVLSACETAVSGDLLPDEVVSFPSALLQAGVAGVVSSQTIIGDRAATLLVLRFFAGFRDGLAPARALADAQEWLRESTNAEIHAAYPGVHDMPGELPDEMRGFWEQERGFAEPHAWAGFSYSGA